MKDLSKERKQIQSIINKASKIVVVQADNPDADSLASALALEQILGDLNKETYLYCGVDLPSYLKYLPGSDRVNREFPKHFDASIIVDTSSDTLLEQLDVTDAKSWLAAKPVVVIDHHVTKPTITFAEVIYNYPAVATGEIIYELTNFLDWPLNDTSRDLLAIAILSDSLGLTSEATTAKSIRIIATLVEEGVNLAELENARRETMRKDPELIHYKGRLLERVEFHHQNKIATVTIPWEEIEKYSPLYNPPMLVLDDMRLAIGTDIAIAFKTYGDKKLTAKIRCNYGKGIADKLAEYFGGGGHSYAAGFKITDGRNYNEIKEECIKIAYQLLQDLEKKKQR